MMQVQREESASAAAAAEEEDPKNSLSFRLDSPERISAVDRHINNVHQFEAGEGDGGDDFDFSFIRIPDSGPSIAADDIFSDGKIRPVYPVFNRDLLKDEEEEEKEEEEEDQTLKSIRVSLRRLFSEEERDRASSSFSFSSASSSASLDELDGVPEGTYCVWTPSKDRRDRWKKSRSTGTSMSFRWRLRDLVVGRSQSDGKEKFLFIPIADKGDKDGGGSSNSKKESSKLEKSKGKKKLGKSPPSTEVDMVTAQQRMMQHHGQQAGNKGSGSGRGRSRSYLPYKPDVVGFFANVNGLSRSHHHPF